MAYDDKILAAYMNPYSDLESAVESTPMSVEEWADWSEAGAMTDKLDQIQQSLDRRLSLYTTRAFESGLRALGELADDSSLPPETRRKAADSLARWALQYLRPKPARAPRTPSPANPERQRAGS